MRWALNTPGYLDGDRVYAPAERAFPWSKRFLDARLLTVELMEHDLFNTDGVTERDTDCTSLTDEALNCGCESDHAL